MAKLNEELTYLLKQAILGTKLMSFDWVHARPDQDIFVGKLLKLAPWKDLLSPLEFRGRLHMTSWIAVNSAGITLSAKDADLTVAGLDNEKVVAAITKVIKEDFLEVLPLGYSAYFELPAFPLFNEDVPLSKTLSLVTRRKDELGLAGSSLPEPPTTFLCIKVRGLQTIVDGESAADIAASRFKQFATLAIRSGAIKYTGRPLVIGDGVGGNIGKPSKESHCLLVSDHNHNEIFAYPASNIDFRTYIANLEVDVAGMKVFDNKGTGAKTIISPGRLPETPDEIANSLPSQLTRALAFDAVADDDKDAKPLRTAIEWHFDAETSLNGTVQFIQRFIGIEAMLGVEDEKNGITEKLAIRYAFLLGKTRSERERRVDDFKKAYNLRSLLVHGRTARLTNMQQMVSEDVRSMLLDLIWHEAGEIAAARNTK